jgi:hypothetical protein
LQLFVYLAPIPWYWRFYFKGKIARRRFFVQKMVEFKLPFSCSRRLSRGRESNPRPQSLGATGMGLYTQWMKRLQINCNFCRKWCRNPIPCSCGELMSVGQESNPRSQSRVTTYGDLCASFFQKCARRKNVVPKMACVSRTVTEIMGADHFVTAAEAAAAAGHG